MVIPKEDTVRECTKCGITKPLSDYLPYRIKSNGKLSMQFRCRSCYNIYNREWRAKEGNRYREKMKNRWHDKIDSMSENERVEFNAKMAKKVRIANKKLKDAVYDAYGYQCACCGEAEEMFLTIDHINNDGAEHRRSTGIKTGGTRFYRWLIKNNFPEGFQVLCWNCQWGKVKNNGVCPHSVTCNDYPVMGVESSDSKRSAPLVGGDIVYSA